MKVSLVDLDINRWTRRKFPNLALMKLSAYYKAKRYEVSLNDIYLADMIYASCVFTWNSKWAVKVPQTAHIGGSGISLSETLPDDIEHIMPDYDLYSGVDFSMGYTSRGCIRDCPWCKVRAKEGPITAWASPREFWNPKHSRLIFLDNNTLAAPNCRETLIEAAAIPAVVDFNQGNDIRLVDDEKAALLRNIKTQTLRFAFDSLSYESSVRRGIAYLLKAGFTSRHLSFYALIGFPGDDTWLERMKILASFNVNVYPMIYRDDEGKEGKVQRHEVPDIFWHGARSNINKFLSVVGRLPGRG